MPDNSHLLIIGKVWPEPTSSAAGSRMMQLIELFRNSGWKITFSSSASMSDHSADLHQLGVEQKPVKLNDSSFDRFVRDLRPDIVLFDRYMIEEQFGWRVAENHPHALRILDTIDLHSLRLARQDAWKKNREFKPNELLNEETAKREIASIYRSDLTLIISDVEMKILQELFQLNEDQLFYLPYLLDVENELPKKDVPTFDERKNFVTIGNFKHEPNWNGILWLKEELWPKIRKELPSAELHIYGSYPSQKVFQLHKPEEGFLIKGRADHAKEVIQQAKVLLAPLRYGAGLKGKLVEAMQCGTPTVTTSVGAEGIATGCKWNGIITDKPDQFAHAAVQLYKNDDLWYHSQESGYQVLKKRFDRTVFEPILLKRIKELRENLKNHRQKNFIGSMLMHHTMNSTKFMARWIEEKNK